MENQVNQAFKELSILKQVLDESRNEGNWKTVIGLSESIANNAIKVSMLFVQHTGENSLDCNQQSSPKSTANSDNMLTSSDDSIQLISGSSTSSGEVNQPLKKVKRGGEKVDQPPRKDVVLKDDKRTTDGVKLEENLGFKEQSDTSLENRLEHLISEQLLKKFIMETHRASRLCGNTLIISRYKTLDKVTECSQNLLSSAASRCSSPNPDGIAKLEEKVVQACSKVREVPATDVEACELAICDVYNSKLMLILDGMESDVVVDAKQSVTRAAFKMLLTDIGLLLGEIVEWMKAHQVPVDTLDDVVVCCQKLAEELTHHDGFKAYNAIECLRNQVQMHGVKMLDSVADQALELAITEMDPEWF